MLTAKKHYSVKTLMYKDNKPVNFYVNLDDIEYEDDAVTIALDMLGKYNEYITDYNNQYNTDYKCSVAVFKHFGNDYDIVWLENSIHWKKGNL